MEDPPPLVVVISHAGREGDDESLIPHGIRSLIASVVFLHQNPRVVLVHTNSGGYSDRETGFGGNDDIKKMNGSAFTIRRGAESDRCLADSILSGVINLPKNQFRVFTC